MVNYPNKKGNYKKKATSYSNRGMSFEKLINESNMYYRTHELAVIHKKPIPIQIVKVKYPSRQKAVISEAYYKVPSTTDYNGIYKGWHIDFEAKETINKTSFPLRNIHMHQIKHMLDIDKHNGIAFVIIHFKPHNEIYIIDIKDMTHFAERGKIGRKSISYDEIKEVGYLVPSAFAPRVDYLKVVDKLIEKKKLEK